MSTSVFTGTYASGRFAESTPRSAPEARRAAQRSGPMAFDPAPVRATLHPMPWHPAMADANRLPVARHPYITALIPTPAALIPHVAGTRRRHHFDARRRGGHGRDDHRLRGGRRRGQRGGASNRSNKRGRQKAARFDRQITRFLQIRAGARSDSVSSSTQQREKSVALIRIDRNRVRTGGIQRSELPAHHWGRWQKDRQCHANEWQSMGDVMFAPRNLNQQMFSMRAICSTR